LSWTLGEGSSNTLLRYSTGTYPTTTGEGKQIYAGSALSTLLSSLTSGTTYFISGWGYDGSTYSSTYTELVVTTTAFQTGGGTFGEPSTPPGWNQKPSGNKLKNFSPFYQIAENLRADINMDDGMFWLGLTFLFMIVAFMAVLFLNGSGIGGLMASIMVLIVGVGLGTVPMVAGFIIMIIGIALLLMLRGI
jgi:hypothetical protein